ncbi:MULTISPECIES: hypothetical protein [Rhizobium/Agrobacterium group]|uniref:Uncharacterized protein n=1 Tax=Allorhizobium ampelinum (strain ATCC BAA-846 / DSM 112012 / S4) TaxID=311402 RepID=B9K5Y2_ALLAM|nr:MULTISPECIES: hypothetical protein [Rhizobium/Agrobacterium group]ACM40280.1 conserved hypothetical protein [Allorhizobium ampelinum S4]MCF1450032.1 hypothetical protein [Allorhizobium ampelinum]MCL6655684.1 hypothetical protein [Agrobacterium rubi]MUO31605.1 hypothetical protein [Agrobacterium vitis]
MVKRDTSVTDFAVAPRKPRQEPQVGQSVPSKAAPATPEVVVPDKAANMQPTNIDASATNPQADVGPNQQSGKLISADEDVRRERTTTRALRQEASRLRLQDLKQTKARESKHFVNCPLDFDTKQRLARAAVENEIKMTVIIKTAIDQYLRDNGY